MRRTAKAGEFRSNLHRGGKGAAVRIPRSYSSVAIRATKAMGLEVAGVDLLEGRHGPKVLEINSSPGLEGIEKATEIDVAGALIAHAERYADEHGRITRKALDERIFGAIQHERTRPLARTEPARSTRPARKAAS
jgi:ribosomal protein S6--L-glutamate ligase